MATAKIKLTWEIVHFIRYIQAYHTAYASRREVWNTNPYFISCEMKNPMTIWSAVSNKYVVDTFGLSKAEITLDTILEVSIPDNWEEYPNIYLEVDR